MLNEEGSCRSRRRSSSPPSCLPQCPPPPPTLPPPVPAPTPQPAAITQAGASSAAKAQPVPVPAAIMLDDVDRRIISLLHDNARIPNTDLARAVGISPSTCLTRVRSLRTRGVITRYTAEINPRAL